MADLLPASYYRGLSSTRLDRWHLAIALIEQIKGQDHRWRQDMADVAQRYNADWAVPLRDVAGEPTFPSIAAQLLSESIDSNAQRANDSRPTIDVPEVGRTGEESRKRASLRRRSWYAHYHESQLSLRLARAYRHLFGYDTYCLKVGPDFAKGYACVSTENPLVTYPEPMDSDEIRLPHYVGFVYGRTASQLRKAYPQESYPDLHSHLEQTKTLDESADVYDIMYWVDDGLGRDEPMILMGILGRRERMDASSSTARLHGNETAMLLDASPNRAGIVPVVCPKGPTLDRPISDMTRVVPIVDLLNKAFALDFIASEKAVFPDRYVVGVPGRAPKIVGGNGGWADGRTGRTNLLEDVSSVGELQSQPGPLTQALIANLERNARMSSGNPAMMQGELTGSVRSGQTVNALAGMSVDPKLKEAQHVMEYALERVNYLIATVEKAYFPAKSISMFSGWPGAKGKVEYEPEEIWEESTDSTVTYSMAGVDASQATVALGQMMQARMISRRTAQQRHPMVDDAEAEEAGITAEAWTDILQQSVIQQVAQGQMALTDVLAVTEKIKAGQDPIKALVEVQQEAQERQAQQAPPEQPELAQPGINDPAAGGQMQQEQPGVPPAAAMEQMVQALQAQPQAAGAPA